MTDSSPRRTQDLLRDRVVSCSLPLLDTYLVSTVLQGARQSLAGLRGCASRLCRWCSCSDAQSPSQSCCRHRLCVAYPCAPLIAGFGAKKRLGSSGLGFKQAGQLHF